jgi:hypothetical protein
VRPETKDVRRKGRKVEVKVEVEVKEDGGRGDVGAGFKPARADVRREGGNVKAEGIARDEAKEGRGETL